MLVSFKINSDVISQRVETIYINDSMNRVVLHYETNANVAVLMQLSFKYKLPFYKYANDGHIGITIPLESIFNIEY